MIRKSCVRVHDLCCYRYVASSSRVKYPSSSNTPQPHRYDPETHRQYREAMAHLKSKKERGVSVFVENRRMVVDLLKQANIPSHIFYVNVRVIIAVSTQVGGGAA